jgi:hypothetical protein
MQQSQTINTPKRRGRPWNNNEVNRLYNEYELKQLTISEISKLHERSEHAIVFRLMTEGLVNQKWDNIRGWTLPDYSDKN